MEVHPLLGQLDSALAGESASGRGSPPTSGISPGMRDGSAHVLRCLKVWYDLPSDVFHTAVANIDTFLAKMKAQPKHLSCIAVSSFHLACSQYQMAGGGLVSVPDPSDLVTISQSRCSSSDLLRMESILSAKLAPPTPTASPQLPVTPLTCLRIMWAVSRAAATSLDVSPGLSSSPPPHLLHRLEILVCDSSTLKFRSAELALALLYTEFQAAATNSNTTALMGFIAELQKYCNIPSSQFMTVLNLVGIILEKYNAEGQVPHRQRLVWKLSNRTLRHLRPTDRLRATLPTIAESVPSLVHPIGRCRSHSESSDDMSDSDASRNGGSDSESDLDIEEPRTWAKIVASS